MALLTGSLWIDIVLAVATAFGLFYYYMTYTFDYWQKRGVPYIKPIFLFGNVKDLFLRRKNFLVYLRDIYNSFPGERFGGYYEARTPVMILRDAELIERILIKDFSNFSDRGIGGDPETDPLIMNLFSIDGQQWKILRHKLSPTFTSGKLKGMLEQICNCGDEFLKEIEKRSNGNKALDAKDLGTFYTIDVIASCAFGLQFKPDSPEGIQFRKMFDQLFSSSRAFIFFIILFFRPLARLFRIRQFSEEMTNYYIDLVRTTIRYRKENNIQRNDFLQLMMNLREQEESGKEVNWKSDLSEEDAYLNQLDYAKDVQKKTGVKVMTDECIAAQAFVFFIAGTDVVANAVAFTLFELASNPDVQTRLQEEVDSTLKKSGGKLTYERLKEMTYLDMVLQERARKYSETSSLIRSCNAPYKIPGTNVVLEKGSRLTINIEAIHNDPAIYPEPDKFIPERFEGNNYRSSGTYLPFGDGPRMCIGMRFAILELKVCVAKIMSRYSVTLDPKTKVPFESDPKSVSIMPKGGIWIRFGKRSLNS